MSSFAVVDDSTRTTEAQLLTDPRHIVSMEFSNGMPSTDELDEQTIVPQMLEVQAQKLARPNEKSLEWFNSLECLSVEPRFKNTLRLGRLQSPREYIAVSYSCKPMETFEGTPTHKFWVEPIDNSEEHPTKQSATRDLVITRVIEFTKAFECDYFWIAEDCIQEKDREEAINSMDLVYQSSVCTLGLLSIILQTEQDITQLRDLLMGELTSYDHVHPPVVRCSKQAGDYILGLLWRFRNDRWWKRQWIFQEEYLSGPKMTLLVRNSPEAENFKHSTFPDGVCARSGVSLLDRELCINAIHFREKATLFLLAVLRDEGSRSCHNECNDLLISFGRYNLLYKFHERDLRKAMSCRVFGDLERREVTRRYDLLAIAANSCDYAIRFDSETMAKKSYSIKFCALMMYVLNGEIIVDRGRQAHLPPESLAQLLDSISFRDFDPPVRDRQLQWLKKCRLKPPFLTQDGMRTQGFVWEVRDVLPTNSWDDVSRPARKRKFSDLESDSELDLDSIHCEYLNVLATELSNKGHESLARKLRGYCRVTAVSEDWWPVKEYKDIMAAEVVDAIRRRQNLYVASLRGSEERSAVFVGLPGKGSTVFTSFSGNEKAELDGRHRIRHVSLQVELARETSASGLPLMSFIGPANGLAFFKWKGEPEAIVRWPRAWRP